MYNTYVNITNLELVSALILLWSILGFGLAISAHGENLKKQNVRMIATTIAGPVFWEFAIIGYFFGKLFRLRANGLFIFLKWV